MLSRVLSRIAAVTFPVMAAALIAPEYAHAQNAAILACVKNMQAEFKVSGDTAFAECNKKTLAECIKAISDRNYVGEAIRQEGSGYL